MEFIFGALAGVSGILPFVHTNLILGFFQQATPAFAVALAFSHLAFELFPTILFGVPTANQGALALPAQQMVQKGEGMQALFLGTAGLASGALFALLLAPAFILIWPALYAWVGPWTGPVLVGVILIAWVQDGFSVKALGVFLGSGLLGATVFGLPLQDPLFPLLSGLFCVPALLVSGDWREAVFTTAPSWKLSHAFLATVLSGFSVLLPALSPAFIGALAYFFIPHNDPKIALVVGFAIASSKMVFDFLASAVLHKARSAPAAVWLDNHIDLSQGSVPLLASVLVFSLGLGLVWIFRNRLVAAFRIRIPPTVLVGLLAAGALITGGPRAFFVLVWAAAWSTACLSIAPRKYLLGSLMVPAMMFAFGKFF